MRRPADPLFIRTPLKKANRKAATVVILASQMGGLRGRGCKQDMPWSK